MLYEKIELFEAVMSNSKLTPAQVVQLTNMFNQPKPQIIVTIEGGSFQYATANMDVELIIDDVDNISNGDDLEYPCLADTTQEGFDTAIQKAYEQILFQRAKNLKDEPVTEVRIFIHDPKDSCPYNVAVNGDVLATYETMGEANDFLFEYLKSREV